MVLDTLKNLVRRAEARVTPRRATIVHQGRALTFVRSHWWDDTAQDNFDHEIVSYFDALQALGVREPRVIVDAGVASGMFAVPAAVTYPQATVHGFEPSARQRTLVRRNAALNGVDARIRLTAAGLWNRETRLAFRTHGSISALADVHTLPDSLPFRETVPVTTIDAWAARERLPRLDVVKMDIEGAEIEALEGARETLLRLRPALLVQAYHTRPDLDGGRTLEPCATFLSSLGYECREHGAGSGFLLATSEPTA